jgi:hypothetical protein
MPSNLQKRAKSELLQLSNSYGCPQLITWRLGRQLFRAIAVNPKITAAQLRVEVAPELSSKTIYRYLKKSDIQKCKKRPLLDDEKGAARLQ